MEPRGRLRHRWANRKVENGREHMSQSTGCERVSRPSGRNDLTFQLIHDGEAQMSNALLANGADGISDIEGKVARARDERAWATSEFQCFRSLDGTPFLFSYFLALLPPKLRSQWARSDSDATCM